MLQYTTHQSSLPQSLQKHFLKTRFETLTFVVIALWSPYRCVYSTKIWSDLSQFPSSPSRISFSFYMKCKALYSPSSLI